MRRYRRPLALAAAALVGALAVGCSKPQQSGSAPGQPFSFTLQAYTTERPYNPLKDRLAEAIQQELAKSGVHVEIRALPWAEHLDAVRVKEEGDAFLLGWIGDNGDVDNFLYTFFHSSQTDGGLNNAGYKNERVDQLLKEAQMISDPKRRAELYLDAMEQISADVVWVPIAHMNDYLATTKEVKGLAIHPTGYLDLRHVTVEGKSEFVFGRGADSIRLDPAKIEDGQSAQVVEQIFESLYTYKPGNTEVVPLLADGMPEISEDGRVYTIKLKQGIQFHDGTPFNAEAVKYSIERQLTGNKEEMPYADFTFGMVESVEARDEYTVVITLKEPVAPFLANLAMGLAAPIISPAAEKKYGDAFGENPVGTGPFMFESWEKDQQIVLRRNPNYWNKDAVPKVETVIFRVIKESNLRVDALLKGEIDAMDGISPVDIPRLQEGANLLTAPGMNISYMGFRVDRPPFDNPDLRKAIIQLIDREALVQGLYQGAATPAQTYIPPFMQKTLEELAGRTPPPGGSVGMALSYNPEAGKALLQSLGYSTK